MTLQQEAAMKISNLPDAGIRLVLDYIDYVMVTLKVPKSDSHFIESGNDVRRTAFLNIQEYKRQHPFLKDIDWEKEREEAMVEKYGRFD